MSNTTGKDLTQGSITKNLLIFAVPFLVANFIQAMYGAVDMAIVGWFADSAGISAVSTGSQVMQIVTSLVSGLTMGSTILIAQFFGAKQEKDAADTIGTTLTLFTIAAGIFTVLMLIFAEPLLWLLQTPPEAFAGAASYVRVCSCGILFIFGYNAISAILRGLGDSKNPMIFVGIACVVNILLDLLFVGPMGMGPAGAALATILSQGISMGIAVIYLSRKKFLFTFHLKNFRVYKDKALALFRIGLPISLQDSMVNVSFLIIAAIVNSLGVVTSAAVGIAGKFNGFSMLPAIAFSAAIASMTAQNIGAKQPERAKKTLRIGILLSLACAFVFFGWVQIFPESVMMLFKADAAVTAAGAEYLRSFSIDFLLVAFVFCMNGFFNGCGHTSYTMINGLTASLLVRVPLAFALSRLVPDSLLGIGLAAPAASTLSVVWGLFYIRSGKWKTPKVKTGPDGM